MIAIGHVDWTALRKEGFDAVVIDKDNCLVRLSLMQYPSGGSEADLQTLPERDELYTPLQVSRQD